MKRRRFHILLTAFLTALLVICPALRVPAIDDIQIDHDEYTPGQYIVISYTGVTQTEEDDEAWITIADAGADADKYRDWSYVSRGSGTLWLPVPEEEGSYEVRFYKANRADNDNLAAAPRRAFTVSGERPSDDTPRYPTRNDFDGNLMDFTAGTRSWTGTYETNYDTLYMLQDGDTVTGEYPGWDNGRLDGIVENGMVYGYWYESPSYAPPEDAGQLVFALHPDGQGFTGWWRYGNNGSWGVWSSGTLNRQTASASMEEDVYAADAHKLIPDCLQETDLTQPITAAEFCALAVRLFEEIGNTVEIPEETPYENIEGHPLQSEIEKAWGMGALKPIAPDSFAPDEGFTRELMACMYCNLIKACEFDGVDHDTVDTFFLPYTVKGHFDDEDEITGEAMDSVLFLTGSGLMEDAGENRFEPAGEATREVAITVAGNIYLMESEK